MPSPILGKKITPKNSCTIRLGKENSDLVFEKTCDPHYLNDFIFSEIQKKGVEYGIGGYLEKRAIYQASENFTPERNIHLAVDIWGEVGTTVHAPLDSIVHSFKYNALPYDYGGTIILQHQENEKVFHTLYGHLSKSSLIGLEKNQVIKAGTPFCQFGDWDENGGWPPHLHFQMIIDMQNMEGDYVGVCEEKDLEFYKNNCPDPSFLIC